MEFAHHGVSFFLKDLCRGVRGIVVDPERLAGTFQKVDLDAVFIGRLFKRGKPLYEIVKDADRATVGFTRFIAHKSDFDKPRKNKVELDSSQLQELISLLREPKSESFAGGCLCLSKANVTFYRDSSVIMSVKVIGNDFGQLEKHPLDLESNGMWVSAHPEKIKAFFERLDSNKKPEPPASTAEP